MKVKELFSDESRWTRRAEARTKDGESVGAFNPTAYSFCILGAIIKCYGRYGEGSNQIVNKIFDITSMPITVWNDLECTSFEEVKALVEKLDI